MSRIGLTLGFYGGIAIVGWFFQVLFITETKNKSLEEIDILFTQLTPELVKDNLRSSMVTFNNFISFQRGKAFSEL